MENFSGRRKVQQEDTFCSHLLLCNQEGCRKETVKPSTPSAVQSSHADFSTDEDDACSCWWKHFCVSQDVFMNPMKGTMQKSELQDPARALMLCNNIGRQIPDAGNSDIWFFLKLDGVIMLQIAVTWMSFPLCVAVVGRTSTHPHNAHAIFLSVILLISSHRVQDNSVC